MAKKERLGSDPLSFIKDTRIGKEAAEVKPVAGEEPVKHEAALKDETGREVNMQIKPESSGRAIISFDGEMSIYNVKQIKNPLVDSIKDYSGIELDLSKVSKIDTAGYQLLIAAKREANVKGKSVRLLNPAVEVKNIFNLYGESIA
ncbi:MAG: STAS domain-containing protein [Spirochaetes bacterium]|nr:STAS domain-containing protein [Spirochaetota bacterium]